MIKTTLLKGILIFLALTATATAQNAIFVAANGNDANPGGISAPLATLEAAVQLSRTSGIKVIYLRGGIYPYNSSISLGSGDNGLTISGYENEIPVFDAGSEINLSTASRVTNNLGGRIKNSAVSNIYAIDISDTNHINALLDAETRLSFDDKAISISRFPNVGLTILPRGDINSAIERPNTPGTVDNPVGYAFKMASAFAIDNQKWQAEIERHKKVTMTGYTSAVWLIENTLIASATYNGNSLRAANGSRYGIFDNNYIKRAYFSNILYELDQPGEWFFDEIDNKLYLYPTTPNITQNSKVTIWGAVNFIEISGGRRITIEKLKIQNVGKDTRGVINIKNNSRGCRIAGVTIQNANTSSFNIRDGFDNSIVSCDMIDAQGCRLYGGRVTSTAVEAGNNLMENCHYTMVYAKDFYGKMVGINGAGNIFRNNLCHNTNGQPLTFVGPDHILENNEFFNTGVQEGDGGAFYIGNSMWTFGNQIRNNFFHHMMTVIGYPIDRAAIHFDDLASGGNITKNIIYRTGMGINLNQGGGHDVSDNIIMGSGTVGVRDFWRSADGPEVAQFYQEQMNYIENNPFDRIKSNYIGRALQKVGTANWSVGLTKDNWIDRFDSFWVNRYPKFKDMMDGIFNAQRMLPYETKINDNLFFDNKLDIRSHPTIIEINGNEDIDLGIFTNPENLNFSYNGNEPTGSPDIEFNSIGLYLDRYRCAIPDKNVYRKAVKDYFRNRSVNGVPLDFNTMNALTYFNSGLAAWETVPCSGVTEENEICNIGSSCDDGNECTINDVYVKDCECKGELAFEPVRNGGLDIGSGGGNTFVVGQDNNTYQWDNCTESFVEFATTPLAKRIDVDGDGNPWIIGTDDNVYRWNGNEFTSLSEKGVDIGVNGNHTFIVGMDKKLYKFNDGSWQILPYDHTDMLRVDVTSTGQARAIGENGINYWDQGNGVFPKGDLLSKDISVPDGDTDHYTLANDGSIQLYLGSAEYENLGGTDGIAFSIGNENAIWLINSTNLVMNTGDCSDESQTGNTCNDGNECTVDDVYVSDCKCEGTLITNAICNEININFVAPTDNATFGEGQNIIVEVAINAAKSISSTTLFVNDIAMRQIENAPYIWGNTADDTALVNMLVGTYELKVVAVDVDGVSEEETVNITIEADNIPPIVNFGSPTNNAIFAVGDEIQVLVEASDTDGAITAASLYLDDRLVGENDNAPYQWSSNDAGSILQNLAPGAYGLRAVAQDDDGATAQTTLNITIEADNMPPIIDFIGPVNNTIFAVGDEIQVLVEASDTDGAIAAVSLYIDDRLVGENDNAPYQWSSNNAGSILQNLAPGAYGLRAVAQDDDGATTQTTLNITIEADNMPPIVNFIKPTEEYLFSVGEDIEILVEAFDTDGTIAHVRLYIDDVLIGEKVIAPYLWTSYDNESGLLENMLSNTYSIRAQATDDNGSITEKTAVLQIANDLSKSKSLIYPNPTFGIAEILNTDTNNPVIAAMVYSLAGKLLFTVYDNGNPINELDLSSLSTGTYPVLLTFKNSVNRPTIKTEKIIVK